MSAPDIEQARQLLLRRLAPLWEAGGHGIAGRARVYRFLGACLGIDRDTANPSAFTIEQCRAAWRATQGLSYGDVLAWAQTGKGLPERAALAYPPEPERTQP